MDRGYYSGTDMDTPRGNSAGHNCSNGLVPRLIPECALPTGGAAGGAAGGGPGLGPDCPVLDFYPGCNDTLCVNERGYVIKQLWQVRTPGRSCAAQLQHFKPHWRNSQQGQQGQQGQRGQHGQQGQSLPAQFPAASLFLKSKQ